VSRSRAAVKALEIGKDRRVARAGQRSSDPLRLKETDMEDIKPVSTDSGTMSCGGLAAAWTRRGSI
jgi:hypothetical protein